VLKNINQLKFYKLTDHGNTTPVKNQMKLIDFNARLRVLFQTSRTKKRYSILAPITDDSRILVNCSFYLY